MELNTLERRQALIDPTDTSCCYWTTKQVYSRTSKTSRWRICGATTTALAKLAALIDLPLIITASIPEGRMVH